MRVVVGWGKKKERKKEPVIENIDNETIYKKAEAKEEKMIMRKKKKFEL